MARFGESCSQLLQNLAAVREDMMTVDRKAAAAERAEEGSAESRLGLQMLAQIASAVTAVHGPDTRIRQYALAVQESPGLRDAVALGRNTAGSVRKLLRHDDTSIPLDECSVSHVLYSCESLRGLCVRSQMTSLACRCAGLPASLHLSMTFPERVRGVAGARER